MTENEMIEKIVAWLQDEVASTDMTEGLAEDCDDFLMAGRRECAEGLLGYIATITTTITTTEVNKGELK